MTAALVYVFALAAPVAAYVVSLFTSSAGIATTVTVTVGGIGGIALFTVQVVKMLELLVMTQSAEDGGNFPTIVLRAQM